MTPRSQIVADCSYAIALSQSFVRSPEKRLVRLNGSAKGAAEVIPLERRKTLSSDCRGSRIEIVPRVHGTITKVFKQFSMELIGAAFADENHLAAHGQAIFCRKSIRDDFEFPDACQP